MTDTESTFEQLYRDLEDTVQRLEAGDLTLAESLALFERATALAEECNTVLDRAELRVRQLTSRADGELEAEPFEGWRNEVSPTGSG
jgi:exodeoxyribonuclease VII small subunit